MSVYYYQGYGEIPEDTMALMCGMGEFQNSAWWNPFYKSFTTIPSLPAGLKDLQCSEEGIEQLPDLPEGLEVLNCGHTNISYLPTLPSSLRMLVCHGTSITELPILPSNLQGIYCEFHLIPEDIRPNNWNEMYDNRFNIARAIVEMQS